MKKRWITPVLAGCLLLGLLTPAVYAEELRETEAATVETDGKSGKCGENLTWELDGYTLTISGSGEMDDGAPWEEHKDHIEHVVLTGGVTKIGKEAFSGYDRLETVDFGDSLVEIGTRAFYGCEDIVYLHLPATFRIFGAEAFRDCASLKYVYCEGGMPRFNDSCLWTGNYISVFYRTNNPWSGEYTAPLVSSYGGNLGVMMGNFENSDVISSAKQEQGEEEEKSKETEAAEETTEATQATEATEAFVPVTEPVVTVPVTVPETQAVETTAEPTQAPTEETTVPATEETQLPETVEETEPKPKEEQLGSKSWIGLVLIAAVITFLLAGALIFRGARHKGGRYNR